MGTVSHLRRARSLAFVLVVFTATACGSPVTVPSPSVSATTAVPSATTAVPVASIAATLPTLPTLSAPAYVPTTRSEELEAETADPTSNPTLQQAIDMFSATITPLPGATPSSLPAGDGVGATIAMDAIQDHLDELTPAQAAIVDPFLDAPYIELDANGKEIGSTLPGEASTHAPAGVGGVLAGPILKEGETTPETRSYYDHYLPILDQVVADYHSKLPTLIAGITGFQLSVLDTTPADEVGAWMFTGVVKAQPSICHIRVLQKYIEDGFTDEDTMFSFAHEIFHCIEQTINPYYVTHDFPNAKWLIEGAATFTAEYLYHDSLHVDDRILPTTWFTRTAQPLDDSTYQAWALFETFHQRYPSADVFADISAMLLAPPDSTTAQRLATGGFTAPTFEDLWTSSSLRSTSFPDLPWQFTWPGVDPTHGSKDNVTTVLSPDGGTYGVGTYEVDGQPSFVHEVLQLPIDPEVGLIGVVPHVGPMLTQADGKTISIGEGQEKWFCTDTNKCPCPDGTTPKVDLTPLVPPMILAMAATEAMPFVHMTAEKWDPSSDCNDPATSGNPADGKPMVGGEANGDPHMTTYNGLNYDFMSLGEFVTTSDPSGDMVVQERHQPVGSGATIGAVAIGSGIDRATFTATEHSATGGITVRLDGNPITDTTFSIGSVAVAEDASNHSWTATWPDGSTIVVHWNLGFFIKASLTEARAKQAKGALGTYSDNFLGDLTLPDGTPASPDNNYQQFADAWLVTDQTSLFDYDPGQDTETFRIPQPLTTIVDPSAATISLCTTTLGPDATSSEIGSCEFDITATNDTSYASAYKQVTDDRVASLPTGADLVPPAASTGPIIVGSPQPGTGAGNEPVSNGTTPSIGGLTLTGAVSYDPSQPLTAQSLAGSITLAKDTVLVAKTVCPPGGTFDMSVELTARSGDGRASAGLCGQAWGFETDANAAAEIHEGEGWIFIREAGTYDVEASSEQPGSAQVTVQLYSDATPTVVASPDIVTAGSYSTTLASIADTLVVDLAPSNGSNWSITNSDKACTAIYYIAAASDPQADPDDLGGDCWHHATIAIGPASITVPMFIFNRDGSSINITVTPTH